MINSSLNLIGSPIKVSGVKDLIHKYNNFFFDLDGVVWLGDNAIKGSIEALNFLKTHNKRLYYITNNSLRNPEQVQKKFSNFGYHAQVSNIYTGSSIAAFYIKDRYPHIKYVATVGTKSMAQQLEKVGLKVLHIEHIDQKIPFKEILDHHLDPNVEALVMGYDNKINFAKICLLSLYVQKGAKFIGTNPDKATMQFGHRVPGNGSFIACIQSASGKKPQIVGKPNQFILDHLIQKQNLNKQQCIMIGDNLQTDILFGQGGKIDTMCVLTGVTKQQSVLSNNIAFPTYYSDRLQQ